ANLITQAAGGLLHHRFILTAGEPEAVYFLLHCSRGLPRVGVTHRPTLWSPDVPRYWSKPL
ncbi:MAG: hypothetical protein RL720_724, partial [Actinomycetota bacterium]